MASVYALWKYGSFADRYPRVLEKAKEVLEKISPELKQSVMGMKLRKP